MSREQVIQDILKKRGSQFKTRDEVLILAKETLYQLEDRLENILDSELTPKAHCKKLYKRIADAYHGQDGGVFNDSMYYEWLGASQSLHEIEEEDDWIYLLKEFKQSWTFMKYCKRRDAKGLGWSDDAPANVYC